MQCTYTALEACIDGTIHTIIANTNKTNYVLCEFGNNFGW